MMKAWVSKYLAYILFAFLSLTWGSSYILIKKALLSYDPVQLAILRIALAAVCLSVFLPQAIKKIPRKLWLYLIFPGWIGAAIPSYLFAKAQLTLDSSITGILSSSTPLMTLVIGSIIFGLSFTRKEVIGIILGLLGAVLIIGGGSMFGSIPKVVPALLVLLGTVCYALSTNGIHKWLGGISTFHISALAFAFIFPFLVIYLLFVDWPEILNQEHFTQSTLSLITLSLFSTVIASIVYFRLVQVAGPTFSSMVSYFVPIVATLLGVLDGEVLGWTSIAGMILIIFGVYLSKSRGSRRRRRGSEN